MITGITITPWWQGLTPINKAFYVAASFFSAFFLWQLIATLIGISFGSEHDVDTNVGDTAVHDSPEDAHATVAAFKLLSIRSILAFFTLFAWAGALYLNMKIPMAVALLYALIWGLAAMLFVSLMFFLMRKLAETGTMSIVSVVGAAGTVYLDIPANGTGEIRALCSGAMTHFKARTADHGPLAAGVAVRVVRLLGANTVEVEKE